MVHDEVDPWHHRRHEVTVSTAKNTTAKTPALKKLATEEPAAKKPNAKATPTKNPAAKAAPAKAVKKPVAKAAASKAAPKKTSAAESSMKKYAARADLGSPIDGFFGKQPPELRAVLETLRGMVEKVAPDATSSIKWGMPFYSIGKGMMCALGAHKAHVNLILSGPPETFVDPDGLLEGDGKTGKHLKLRTVADIPKAKVEGWLRAAAKLARSKA